MECEVVEGKIVVRDEHGVVLDPNSLLRRRHNMQTDVPFLIRLASLLLERIIPMVWALVEEEVERGRAVKLIEDVKDLTVTIALTWDLYVNPSDDEPLNESECFLSVLRAFIPLLPLSVLRDAVNDAHPMHSELARFLPIFVENVRSFRALIESRRLVPSSTTASVFPESPMTTSCWKAFLALPSVTSQRMEESKLVNLLPHIYRREEYPCSQEEESLFHTEYINLHPTEASPLTALTSQLLAYRWSAQHRKKYYANYFSIVQSSGSGKTRLALELRRSMYVIYLCLRPSDKDGFPQTSSFANTFLGMHETFLVTPPAKRLFPQLEARSDEKYGFLVFFEALFATIKDFVLPVILHLSENERKETFCALTKDFDFWKEVNNKVNSLRRDKYPSYNLVNASETQKLIRFLSHCLGFHQDRNAMFVFVIDEAREMLKDKKGGHEHPPNLSSFRRALRAIDCSSFFSILLDTSPMVRDFFPRPVDDPSGSSVPNFQLYEPFYCFGFLGPWPLRLEETIKPLVDRWSLEIGGSEQYVKFRYNLAMDLCVNSRPLFFGTLAPNVCFLENAIRLARLKLLGERKADLLLLPALCYRYALVPLTFELRERLLSIHAGLLQSIYPHSRSMVVRYAPEPMLGECAAQEMGKLGLNVEIEVLQNALREGQLGRSVSKGGCTELANMAYMLYMMQRANRRATERRYSGRKIYTYFSDWTTVRDLLITMSSSEALVDQLQCNDALNALVSVTCCFPASSSLESALLEHSLSCRTLFMASENEEAIDWYFAAALRQSVGETGTASASASASVDVDMDVNVDAGASSCSVVNSSTNIDWPCKKHEGANNLWHPLAYTPNLGCGGRGVVLGKLKNTEDDTSLGRAVFWAVKGARYGAKRALGDVPLSQAVVVSMVFMIGTGKVTLPDAAREKYQQQDEVFFVQLDDYPNLVVVIVNGFPGVVDRLDKDALRTFLLEFKQSSCVHMQLNEHFEEMKNQGATLGEGFLTSKSSKSFVEKSLATNFRNNIDAQSVAEMDAEELDWAAEENIEEDEQQKKDESRSSFGMKRITFGRSQPMKGTLYFSISRANQRPKP